MDVIKEQYKFVIDSRRVLTEYCGKISYKDFIKENANFGGRSIEFLFLHIINTYQFWLKEFPSQTKLKYHSYDSKFSLENVLSFFENTNSIVENFLNEYKNVINEKITREIKIKNTNLEVTPLQLYTHVSMHEFHHKGQILTMSRMLGYTPVDTDVIRFE
ncbi:MAG: damage-inducible protein DinB [Melioribacteraceae bacterium]|nr:MAG: damage-inducible protein DinB [Melioribacteraceae bacterium]